jgi:inner membrane protein
MIEGLEAHWAWLILAIILGMAEIVAPGVFLIWLAAAAGFTGLVTLATGIELPFQFAIFALSTVASIYFGKRWYEAHPVESADPKLNDRTSRMIGDTVVVVGAIENGRGRVAVGDSVWPARGPDAGVGTRVRVTGSDGTCLKVESVEQIASGGSAEG